MPRSQCSWCGISCQKRVCARCLLARYCSRRCQRNHWSSHKWQCYRQLKIKSSDIHGIGVFSRKAFDAGDVVFKEKILYQNLQMNSDGYALPSLGPRAGDQRFLKDSFELIPDDGIRAVTKTFYQLGAFTDGQWNIDNVEKTLGGVCMSSSVSTIEGEAALFAICSVMNHGCFESINVSLTWSTEDQVMVVRATKTIHQNDELLCCYDRNIQRNDPVDRRNKLLFDYGFLCFCPTCLDEIEAFHLQRQAQSEEEEDNYESDSD